VKAARQLLGGRSGVPSRHTYQPRFGDVRDARDSTNQGCWSLVWFGTQSTSTRSPRSWASATRRSKSASVPNSGSTSQKSATS
jgi:hypothetical protein